MTTKTKPRTPKGAKRRAENPEIRRAAERAGVAEPPSGWTISGPPFDGGEDLRRDATAADLFAVALGSDPEVRSFLRGAIDAAIDDFELLGLAAVDDCNMSDLVRRCAERARDRLKVAVEVDRRMRDASGEVGHG